ncbi:SpoIVB peptidase [Dethiobacter alkaliphilus]|uniref:SpoIVB peptidase n=1 Tax=Dethiobacter alkaliphilus TaxID=427926 RepID=UPI002226837F|nr:SpoIVB peptidase [Dethiobacter alkaliphilus]MCW3490254.1 SpoIVB peptidase [Dethiobacter alkaliphilus]
MKSRYSRTKLVLGFFGLLLLLATAFPWRIWVNLQNDLRILEGEKHYVNIASPLSVHVKGDQEGVLSLNGSPVSSEASKLSLRSPISFSGQGLGSVNLEFRLFGVIPLRQLTVNVLPEQKLIPGGHSIGIKLHSDGVLVVGHHLVNGENGSTSPANEAGIEKGDVILAIDGTKLEDANQVAEIIARRGTAGNPFQFTIKRDGQKVEKEVNAVLCRETGRPRIGLYVRDSAAGVGTLTFYCPQTKRYGALGHVITDVDTNQPIEVKDGRIVNANIVDIKQARRGYPGEKTGIFQESKDIAGNITKNNTFGIFGSFTSLNNPSGVEHQPLPMALMSQVETGPAEILTVVEGQDIERFDIEIQRVYTQSRPGDKGMVIRITDERLLDATGGIVQGMSGSPIIQNGRLVGAVTHVFVNDPTRGYGIFIEWMVMESGILDEIGENV